MTPDEIRELPWTVDGERIQTFIVLREIAAQLAEHNEARRTFIEAVRPIWESYRKP